MKRIIAALFIGLLLGWWVIGFSIHTRLRPNSISSFLIAPGLEVVSRVTVPTLGLSPLTSALLIALVINFVYYAALVYGALTIISRLRATNRGHAQRQ